MVRSCTVIFFQREMWTGKFQHWSTTTGRFINASIKPLHIILVAQICIYLPLPLMIDPPRIKELDISQIWYQLPSLFTLKIVLVLWPPLPIQQVSFLLMVLILSMSWIEIWLCKVGCTEDTVVGNMVKKYDTKRKAYIATHDLIRTRYFIIVMGFPGLFQRQGLDSWNIIILCHNFLVDCCTCLPSIL